MKIARKVLPILLSLVLIAGFFSYVSVGKVSAAEVGMTPVIDNMQTTETSKNVFRVEFDFFDDGNILESNIISGIIFYDPEWNGSPGGFIDGDYRNGIIGIQPLKWWKFESTYSANLVETVNGINKYHVVYDNIDFNNTSASMRGKVGFSVKVGDEADYSTCSNTLFTDYMNVSGARILTFDANRTYDAKDFFGNYYPSSQGGLIGWKLEICNKKIVEQTDTESLVTKEAGQTLMMMVNNKSGEFYNFIINVEEDTSSLSLNKLTYNFSNSHSGFGYNQNYKIPYSAYQMIYGNTTLAKKYYTWYNDEWGGNCYGMSSTSAMFNVPGSGVTLSNFSTSANKVSDLGVKNTGSLGISVTSFIEAMQVSQYSQKIQYALDNTENRLSNLDNAVKSVQTNGKPVLIAVFKTGEGGHALLGYKVEKISETTSYLHVYDCNYPSTDRYITLTTNSSGNVTGWYYHLNDMYNWGSSYSGSSICYVTYDIYQYLWAHRGKVTSSNVLNTNSDSVNIYDYQSNLVASVKDGKLTSSSDDIILVKDTGMTVDGDIAQSDDTRIMMPTDLYTVENKDSSISKFEATMVNSDRAATVGTNSDKVTFAVDDDEELNDVLINSDKGEKYEVSLESSDAKDIGLVEVDGIGEGKKVSVTQERGNVSINNCAGATISINGEAISNTGSDDVKDLKKASARLEYTEVAYDGKAKYPKISIVDANNNLLELGKDYIPFYSNNVNKGVASVTVYGIGAYSGSKTLSFIISDKKADTQPPSLGKVNLKAKNIKKKAVKLSWKKIKNANGYTVQYALNKKFTKKKKTVNVKASKTSKTIKKLKKKKTYYFRARAYCNYKCKKVYGKWSKVKKVKIKK